jgi:glyoxylate/hydroxypyruvate reductase A
VAPLPVRRPASGASACSGLGSLGQAVLAQLRRLRLRLRGLEPLAARVDGVRCHAGADELAAFLRAPTSSCACCR